MHYPASCVYLHCNVHTYHVVHCQQLLHLNTKRIDVVCLSPHGSTPELVTAVAKAMGLPCGTLVLFSADCKWMATPWEGIGAKDDISQLCSHEEVSWGGSSLVGAYS